MCEPSCDQAPDTASLTAASQLAQITITGAKTKARKRAHDLLICMQVMSEPGKQKGQLQYAPSLRREYSVGGGAEKAGVAGASLRLETELRGSGCERPGVLCSSSLHFYCDKAFLPSLRTFPQTETKGSHENKSFSKTKEKPSLVPSVVLGPTFLALPVPPCPALCHHHAVELSQEHHSERRRGLYQLFSLQTFITDRHLK